MCRQYVERAKEKKNRRERIKKTMIFFYILSTEQRILRTNLANNIMLQISQKNKNEKTEKNKIKL